MTAPRQAPQPSRNRADEPFTDPEEYRQALLKCYFAAQFIATLDLDRLAAAQQQAATVGPFLDPTLWMRQRRPMEEDATVVRALQAAIRALGVEFLERLQRPDASGLVRGVR